MSDKKVKDQPEGDKNVYYLPSFHQEKIEHSDKRKELILKINELRHEVKELDMIYTSYFLDKTLEALLFENL